MGNTADTDAVYCLDASTGKEVWKHTYPCLAKDPNGYPGTRCTPTVDGDRVYTVGRQGQLFCLNTKNGEVIWKKNYQQDYKAKVPTWGFSTSPLVEGDLLIVETGGPGAAALALDKKTGKEIWRSGDDAAAYGSPVAFDYKGQRAVVLLPASGLVAHAVKDGKELWRHPWKTSYDVNASTPVIDDEKVFISTGYNTGAALVSFARNPPEVVWQNKNMRNHVNSSVLWQGYLYGFDGQAGRGNLKCLDWKTGEEKWSKEGFGTGSVIVADGKLIVYSDKGKLAVAEASPAGYKELASTQATEVKKELPPNTKGDTWALPVLANGKIYCRSLGQLVCLDVSGK